MRDLWGAVLVFLVACAAAPMGCLAQEPRPAPAKPAGAAQSKEPNEPKDPNELLRTRWNAVISVLRNKDIDPNEKARRIDKIVTPIFDFPLMAKLALGRTHWPKLTPSQQERFTQLFIERLKVSYREKVSLYTDEKVQFKPAVTKDNTICYIPMDLLSKDKKVNIVHKLRKVDKQWKVYDVEIQGVSILLTYRSQFDDILQKGTIEDLLARLKSTAEIGQSAEK